MVRGPIGWLVLCIMAVAAGAIAWYASRPADAGSSHPEPTPAVSTETLPEIHLPAGVNIRFTNVARQAGIDFTHFDGRTDMQYIMDQTGSGVGWLDYDGDGLMDLFLVQGSTFQGAPPNPAPTCKLFKNLGHGQFRD